MAAMTKLKCSHNEIQSRYSYSAFEDTVPSSTFTAGKQSELSLFSLSFQKYFRLPEVHRYLMFETRNFIISGKITLKHAMIYCSQFRERLYVLGKLLIRHISGYRRDGKSL